MFFPLGYFPVILTLDATLRYVHLTTFVFTMRPLSNISERLRNRRSVSVPSLRCQEPHYVKCVRYKPFQCLFLVLGITIRTGCPRRNGQNVGRVFLMLNYTDITQNTYIQSWTVTEIMTIEKCGLLGCPRNVSRPWRHTHPLRMPGNEKPLAKSESSNLGEISDQLRPA